MSPTTCRAGTPPIGYNNAQLSASYSTRMRASSPTSFSGASRAGRRSRLVPAAVILAAPLACGGIREKAVPRGAGGPETPETSSKSTTGPPAVCEGTVRPEPDAPPAQTLPRITLFMAGDSTMATKPTPNNQNERGWGQMMPLLLRPEAVVANHGTNGRSSKSFMEQGPWERIADAMRPGDWVIIQFGHNDGRPEPERHTEPFTTYAAYLRTYVRDTRARGAFPVLATSVVRTDLESHGEYPEAAIAVAAELKTPLLDLEALTRVHVAALADPKEFFIEEDTTHLNEMGASVVARMAADSIRELGLPLAAYLQ